MKILVTAATEAEIALSIKHIASSVIEVKPHVFDYSGHKITFAITGVGAVATTYNLTRLLISEQYGLVIQAGIAGSFDRDIPLGEVLAIRKDRFADIGAEDGEDFIDVFDLGLDNPDQSPYTDKLLLNPYIGELDMRLRAVDAITVNTVTGNDSSVERLGQLYPGMLESMEGAAFHYVCLREKVRFMQIRAVSNYIERRNRDAWEIELAVNNLNEFLLTYLTEKTAL